MVLADRIHGPIFSNGNLLSTRIETAPSVVLEQIYVSMFVDTDCAAIVKSINVTQTSRYPFPILRDRALPIDMIVTVYAPNTSILPV